MSSILCWPIAPSYIRPNAGWGLFQKYSCAHGAQINFKDLTLVFSTYFNYDFGKLPSNYSRTAARCTYHTMRTLLGGDANPFETTTYIYVYTERRTATQMVFYVVGLWYRNAVAGLREKNERKGVNKDFLSLTCLFTTYKLPVINRPIPSSIPEGATVVEEKPNKISLFAVLRIRDVYSGSLIRIFPFRIPDPGSNKFPVFLSQIRIMIIYPSRIQGSKRPGSGSLLTGQRKQVLVYIPWTEWRGAEWSSVSLCPMSRWGAGTAFTSPGTLSFPQFVAVLRIRIRIHPKMSWIRNTGLQHCSVSFISVLLDPDPGVIR